MKDKRRPRASRQAGSGARTRKDHPYNSQLPGYVQALTTGCMPWGTINPVVISPASVPAPATWRRKDAPRKDVAGRRKDALATGLKTQPVNAPKIGPVKFLFSEVFKPASLPNFQEIPTTRLTVRPAAGSLQTSKQNRCVDLHPKPGLFLFHPAIEFASSVQVFARPWEPVLALRTLGAFLFGGSPHE